jgi:hypothetical protein
MQPADSGCSSSDDWGHMYDSDAGIMDAARELYVASFTHCLNVTLWQVQPPPG